jgi:xanthine dehydrogenase molybdopterin-binding subunit B
MEPQVATAWLEPEGGLVVSSSTQGAFTTRQQLADLLGWSHDRVRVRPGAAGGGLRRQADDRPSRWRPCVRAPGAAGAAGLTRMEDFAAVNPAPGEAPRAEGRRDGRRWT